MRRVRQRTAVFVPAPRDDRSSTTADHEVVLDQGRHRATVVIIGRIDPDKVGRISAAARDAVESGVSELVVDLTHAWNGALLLSELAHCRAEIADRGGALRLVGVALPEFLAALAAAPLDEVFLIYDAVRGQIVGRQIVGGDPGSGVDGRRHRSVQRSTDWR